MGETAPGTSPIERPLEDRLDSWKEIAEYLGRDVTTVQRWEKREAMPVHRHVHDRIGSVYAFRPELDAWMRSRNSRAAQETGTAVIPPTLPLESPTPAAPAKTRYLLPFALTAAALAAVLFLWLHKTEHFWRNPLANARFQNITDFNGLEQSATISRDGHFVAFLSDRSGSMDIWLTQVGSGEFHNLTRGTISGLVNPSIRNLAFTPDGSLVTFWFHKQDGDKGGNHPGDISTWAIPVLGGEPRPYLEGVAEHDWTRDDTRLAYHTPGPGDPLFVSSDTVHPESKPIFIAPAGLHSHFPLWSPDAAFLYFVQGTLPDKLDIWRIPPAGGTPERITSHNEYVSHPVLLDRHTLLYLANDSDGSGPWLYSMDVDRRIPHRLTSGLDRYTSLAASMDGRRLVATLATPKITLWRMPLGDSKTKTSSPAKIFEAAQIPITTSTGFSPRLGPGYLLYASATGTSESIWKLANGASTELWRGEGAQLVGAPAISPDGRYAAFSVRQHGQSLLYAVQTDGSNVRIISGSLTLQGSPAWTPDGQSITSAVVDHGTPRLFRIPVNSRGPGPFIGEYSVDPLWSPDSKFVVYSGPDIGTTFSVKAASADAAPHPLPGLTLTRGARHLAFLPGGHALVFMRGDIQHKNLWRVDLDTGAEQPLTHLPADFDIRDFDISSDGHEVVLERIQENSNVVLIDLARDR